MLLQISALRQVDRDLYEPEDSPGFVANGRRREKCGERLARFPLDEKFAGPRFPSGAALENSRAVLTKERRWRELVESPFHRVQPNPHRPPKGNKSLVPQEKQDRHLGWRKLPI